MTRITSQNYDQVELDRVTDIDGTYTPVEISSGNKLGIRFPVGPVYGLETTDDMHLAITLKLEGR